MTAAVAEPTVSTKQWIAVIGAVFGSFMAILDIQITNACLADIQGALAATLDEGSWITTSYLVSEIVVIPLSGWLATVFSRRLYLLVNASLFVFFSMCCGLAWDLPSMCVFRACQGFTGGVLIPMAFSIILTTLPRSKQPIGLALFGLSATFAPAIGPTVGGWLTDNFGWQCIFYVNLIPGLCLISAIWYAIDATPVRLNLLREGDYAGILTMAIGLASLETFLEEGNRKDWFGSNFIVTMATTSAIALTLFLIREFTCKKPFIDLRLLGRRNFGISSLSAITLGVGLYGSTYLLSLYLAQVQKYSALQIGEVVAWVGIPQLFIMPLVPKIMTRVDSRILVCCGLVLFASSCFMNAFMSFDYAGPQLITALFLRALGQPFVIVPSSALATAGMEMSVIGSASGIFNMVRNLGGSIGIALLSTLITTREQLHSERIGESVHTSSPLVREQTGKIERVLLSKGVPKNIAQIQSVGIINNAVRRDSFVMAYNDAFFSVGCVLLFGALLTCLLKKSAAPAASSAAH